jgi:pyruvate dehydrogenase complex dehydrogenase (E1) component
LAVAVEQAQTEVVEAEREAYCTLLSTHLMDHLIQFQLEAVAEAAVAAHKTFQVQLEDNLHLMDTLHLAVVSVRDTEETLEAALEDRAEEQDTQEVQDLQVQVNKVQVVLLQDTEIQADRVETPELEEADQAVQPLLETQEAKENNLI